MAEAKRMKPVHGAQPGDIVVDGEEIAVVKDWFIRPGQERFMNPMYMTYVIADHPYDDISDWRNEHIPGFVPLTVIGHIDGMAQCTNCRFHLVPPRNWCPCEMRKFRECKHER